MKIKNLIPFALRWLAQRVSRTACRNVPPTEPPPQQLDLGLDQPTEFGLPLREAIPVRSAEYWLQLGEPDLALKELQTLPESARQHAWPLRVSLNAMQAATN